MYRLLAFAICVLLAASTLAAVAGEVYTLDGAAVAGKLTLEKGAADFTLQSEGGTGQKLARANLLCAVINATGASGGAQGYVRLRDGSVLAGEAGAGGSLSQISLRRADGTVLEIPLERVAAISFSSTERGISPERPLEGAGLVMRNGKVLAGEFEWISAFEVGIRSSAGRLRLKREAIARIMLAEAAQKPLPGSFLLLAYLGDAVYGQPVSIADTIVFAGPLGELSLPAAEVFALVHFAAQVQPLAGIRPEKAVTLAFTDYVREPVFDRGFTGDLGRVGGVPFLWGAAAHSRTELTYKAEGARFLGVFAGIDRVFADKGAAELSLLGGGKALAGGEVAAGQGPRFFLLPLEKGAAVGLVCDFGRDGSAGDHVFWGCPFLVR